jgi:EAL domain-containing protein (putative c-di-GMP-specific phosphodiesterase class I)/ActR/RegA family two-component response regulator
MMKQKDPVLIALDDDQEIASVICAIGEKAGFNTTSAGSSDLFRELLRERRPDVVVLDLQMPGDDGVSILRHLANSNVRAGILLVTGMDERTIAAAEQYGLSRGLRILGTLQKPFEPDELHQRLERAHAAIRPLTKTDLQQAIDGDELLVYYQPTIRRFADGTWDVAGVEALLRWNHPVRGLLTPASFISMGEEEGLSRAMTDFVLQRGIEQLKGWQAMRLNVGLRVNIAATLISDIDFPDRLEATLAEQNVDPDVLTLEVIETAMLEQKPDTFDILTRLRIKNVNLAIDDFGIGYSSLTQLFRMPFNEMKIDRSLVSRTTESKEACIMVDALVSLAHKLSLTVCAEGVENEETLAFLDSIGCDCAQGFFISPPVSSSQLPKVIARWDQNQRRNAEPSEYLGVAT